MTSHVRSARTPPPSLTVLTYVCGLFYLCTTALATGSGAPQYHLNEILYSAVLIAAIMEMTLYRVPLTRRWLHQIAPYSFAYVAFTSPKEIS